MTIELLNRVRRDRQGRNFALISLLLMFIFVAVVIDFAEAYFKDFSFYIEESLLFNSFWLLFFPLLNLEFYIAKRVKSVLLLLALAITLVFIHLLTFPVLVWILSESIYYHTYPFWSTFEFGLTSNFFKAALIYGIPVVFILIKALYRNSRTDSEVINEAVNSIIVTDKFHKKLRIKTDEVFYFAAYSPYIAIYHKTKKYLYSSTLKSVLNLLDDTKFVRIHKSFIVNILFVVSCQSRGNGDYDVMLENGTTLRVSRNYASAFKTLFNKSHPLRVK